MEERRGTQRRGGQWVETVPSATSAVQERIPQASNSQSFSGNTSGFRSHLVWPPSGAGSNLCSALDPAEAPLVLWTLHTVLPTVLSSYWAATLAPTQKLLLPLGKSLSTLNPEFLRATL